MPGEFESNGKGWRPALVARCENGRIRASFLGNKRLMASVVKFARGEPGPDGKVAEIPITLGQVLGAVLEVPDPANPGRMIPFLEPDPAAVEAIRAMTGEEDAKELPSYGPPEPKPPQVTVVNASGQDARDVELAELRAIVKQQGEMLKQIAQASEKRTRRADPVGA